ncbi:NAD+ synthase [Campylobacter sp. MIT 21-1685]|uniref:NAD+ synthase n=1 Tax=unclassified Campylobacter TaxID=2593542 RepID=UPI00224B2293|nr:MULTISPECIES: NAD+ synthase [unclassified Campylobacter]MCX2683587.1 NAD+ synthase [Campylobacter sp. MIT 21-1684]MCX2751870.1 NAD+ synthase [Campylobacter sp. MIT 21-1682]MCX2808077.1 NAD+ synthase [Campylobacter sp. MIT 21-1685]
MDCEKITLKLCDFIKTSLQKSSLKNVVLGLSGGIDSALVATLCKKALNENVVALLMPSSTSNEENLNDALKLCFDLKMKHKIISIQDILNEFVKQSENIDKVRIGNYAARIRMSLLYDYSALYKALVVGTSNKSELLLGYGTIYGDLAYGFNPLGSLYKSEVFKLAHFLKLDKVFLNKAPSADLWEGQSDEKDLGFSYAVLDEGLQALESNDELKLAQCDVKLLAFLKERIEKNAFKRQMPEIAEFD